MSLLDQARRATEYAKQLADEVWVEKDRTAAEVRETEAWRAEQTRLGNEILQRIPGLVERRATDGHKFCWIMDIEPDQFTSREMPLQEYNLPAIQAKLFGAARIAGEFLKREKLRVFINHKGCLNGNNRHEMLANWAQRGEENEEGSGTLSVQR